MKNIIKISLIMTVITFMFLLLGGMKVNAASNDIVFKKNLNDTTNISELDFGDIHFGESSVILTVYAVNTTSSTIKINGYDMPIVSFSAIKNLSRVGNSLATPLTIESGDHIHLQFEIFEADMTNFPRDLNCTFVLIAENDERFSLNLKATDVKKTISSVETPTLNPANALTYNGIEQTMNFYTFDGSDYTLIDFDDPNSMFTITGNKATSAGTHTAEISLRYPDYYEWDDTLPNVSGVNNRTYSVEWEIERYITSPPKEQDGIVGLPLYSINLPAGWTWDEPNTVITTGNNEYDVTYIHPDNNINYATVNSKVTVNGQIHHSIEFYLTENSSHDAQSNPTYLIDGTSKTYTLSTDAGYIFTSIKINGIEQLLKDTIATNFPIDILNINENYTIIAETEQIIFSPVVEYENLTYDRYINDEILIKWDLDFDNFKMINLRINNIDIKSGFSFKQGSVILELDSTVIDKLQLGENKIEIDLASGELAVATFNLIDSNPIATDTINPSTNDNIIVYSIIGFVSIISIILIINIRKKTLK